ncbi:MAG TPA: cytochrome-c oxidase, cbb3-type subunit III [Acidiferrobacterales bacterium]|nr:cytochrome-c oxidase, cbb3-type subunit III [Acidiferrobacterales bacterium]
MADFTSKFWEWYIFILVGLSFAFCFALIIWMQRGKKPAKVETMGHEWDGIAELNNPLPVWWLYMFYLTLVFGIVYLLIYPGSGVFAGAIQWSEVGQYEREMKAAEQKYGPLYEKHRTQDIRLVAANPEALKIGQRLYMTYCTACHGSDAGGGPGFPNLRDQDWLYGGQPEMIKASIADGRNGAMPPWGAVLGADGVHNVSEYVLSLSGRKVSAEAADAGKDKYQQLCVACHGADGKGNPAMGAPNLTDNVWLYGGSQAAIMKSISDGRSGRMPAHGDFLGDARVHLLAAYIYSLSTRESKAAK